MGVVVRSADPIAHLIVLEMRVSVGGGQSRLTPSQGDWKEVPAAPQ